MQAVPYEQPDEDQPGGDGPERDRVTQTAVALGLREAEDDAHQPWAQQCNAEPVERAGIRPPGISVKQAGSGGDRHDGDGQVDEEDPLPGGVVHDEAADDRPEDGAEQNRHAYQPERSSHAPRPGALRDQREANRDEHAAPNALKDTERDQLGGRGGERAQR